MAAKAGSKALSAPSVSRSCIDHASKQFGTLVDVQHIDASHCSMILFCVTRALMQPGVCYTFCQGPSI